MADQPQPSRSDVAVVVGLAFAPAIGLGVARFAYALILPDMRTDLGWSFAQAGSINTTNAAGYLLGALCAAQAIRAIGAYRLTVVGVWACILSLLLCALSRDVFALNAARLLAGLGGGFAFVSGGVLAAGVAQRNPDRSAFLLGLFYAGPGLGILLSGLVVPFLMERFGTGSWALAWVALSVLSIPLALGLRAARAEHAAAPQSGHASSRYREMKWLFCGYLLFGAGYIAYMTFMIAWVQGSGGSSHFQTLFWCVIGIATMTSPWLWTAALNRLRHGYAIAVLTAVTAIGTVLPLLSEAAPTLLLSSALFGSTFFAVVAATTSFVRRNLPQERWAATLGMLTVAFGTGQVLGPVAIGSLNDLLENLSGGLWASGALLSLAALCGAMQRDLGES